MVNMIEIYKTSHMIYTCGVSANKTKHKHRTGFLGLLSYEVGVSLVAFEALVHPRILAAPTQKEKRERKMSRCIWYRENLRDVNL
jgi:hypothetical protein